MIRLSAVLVVVLINLSTGCIINLIRALPSGVLVNDWMGASLPASLIVDQLWHNQMCLSVSFLLRMNGERLRRMQWTRRKELQRGDRCGRKESKWEGSLSSVCCVCLLCMYSDTFILCANLMRGLRLLFLISQEWEGVNKPQANYHDILLSHWQPN